VTRLAYEHLGLTPRNTAKDNSQLSFFSDEDK